MVTKSYDENIESYANSIGVTSKDIPIVLYLCSFHSVGRSVRKNTITGEYIYCQYESSEMDDVEDKFSAHVITPEKYAELQQEKYTTHPK